MIAGDVCPNCGEGRLIERQLAVISLAHRVGFVCSSCNHMWVQTTSAVVSVAHLETLPKQTLTLSDWENVASANKSLEPK